jgi:hypothetical protein
MDSGVKRHELALHLSGKCQANGAKMRGFCGFSAT